jgi:hypothetical protein
MLTTDHTNNFRHFGAGISNWRHHYEINAACKDLSNFFRSGKSIKLVNLIKILRVKTMQEVKILKFLNVC